MEYDNCIYPGKFIKTPEIKPVLNEYSREDIGQAKDLIAAETNNEDYQKIFGSAEEVEKTWQDINEMFEYYPGTKEYESKEGKSLAEIVEAKEKTLERYAAHFEKLRKDILKTEEKTNKNLESYIFEEADMKKRYEAVIEKFDQEKLKLAVFRTLKAQVIKINK